MGYPDGSTRYAAKPEQACNDRDDEKCECPAEHDGPFCCSTGGSLTERDAVVRQGEGKRRATPSGEGHRDRRGGKA